MRTILAPAVTALIALACLAAPASAGSIGFEDLSPYGITNSGSIGPGPAGNPSGTGTVWHLTSNGPADTVSSLQYTPSGSLTLGPTGSLNHLSAVYNMTDGNFAGGSPRFAIGIDVGGTTRHVMVHWPDNDSLFQVQSPGWQDTGNLLDLADTVKRVEFAGGGAWGMPGGSHTFADALALLGQDYNVVEILLPVDGGWSAATGFNQDLYIDSITINDQTFLTPEPASLFVWGSLMGLGGLLGGARRRQPRVRA